MKVLFATTHQHMPECYGGSEASIHGLCVALASEGHEVAVLAGTLRPPGLGDRLRPAPRPDRQLGYAVYRCVAPVESARAVLRRVRPAVVVVQTGSPMGLAAVCIAARARVIVYLRDVQFHHLGGPILRGPRLAYLANSRFTAGRYQEAFGLDAEVIPPLVSPDGYRTAGEGDRVVFVNPHPLKGLETALHLARSRPDVPFDFVQGWNVPPERWRRRAERIEASRNVRIVPNSLDMRSVYSRARVLLVPSLGERGRWEEGWGRVATEAQCSGIPVLATRSGGLPESVGAGGLLVDPAAPPDVWEKCFAEIWDDPVRHRALSEAAVAHAARPEIQPGEILRRFVAALVRHART